MITLDEARENIGRAVVYVRPHGEDYGKPKFGVVVAVQQPFVYVRYEPLPASTKATDPNDLDWLSP